MENIHRKSGTQLCGYNSHNIIVSHHIIWGLGEGGKIPTHKYHGAAGRGCKGKSLHSTLSSVISVPLCVRHTSLPPSLFFTLTVAVARSVLENKGSLSRMEQRDERAEHPGRESRVHHFSTSHGSFQTRVHCPPPIVLILQYYIVVCAVILAILVR